MTHKTTVSLECATALYSPWEVHTVTIEHEEVATYRFLYERAIKLIGGPYVTYGALMVISEEMV